VKTRPIVGRADADKVDWHPSVVTEARETRLSADDDGYLIVGKLSAQAATAQDRETRGAWRGNRARTSSAQRLSVHAREPLAARPQ